VNEAARKRGKKMIKHAIVKYSNHTTAVDEEFEQKLEKLFKEYGAYRTGSRYHFSTNWRDIEFFGKTTTVSRRERKALKEMEKDNIPDGDALDLDAIRESGEDILEWWEEQTGSGIILQAQKDIKTFFAQIQIMIHQLESMADEIIRLRAMGRNR
jgi:hypothetical protein